MRKTIYSLAVLAGIIAFVLVVAGGVGTHLGLFHFRTGLQLFFIGGQTGMFAAGVLAFLAGLALAKHWRSEALWAFLAAVLAVAAFLPGVLFKSKAGSVPAIHDISTDTSDPPLFVKVLPLRGEGTNSTEYGGEEIARQQKAAYPDIQTLEITATPAEAFARALGAAKALGWDIVEANEGEGRIEATDTTAFFGFKDDIVIRVRGGDKTKVDVRSLSRVGRSDVGANAGRIRRFFARF